jgi:hypothetical protein
VTPLHDRLRAGLALYEPPSIWPLREVVMTLIAEGRDRQVLCGDLEEYADIVAENAAGLLAAVAALRGPLASDRLTSFEERFAQALRIDRPIWDYAEMVRFQLASGKSEEGLLTDLEDRAHALLARVPIVRGAAVAVEGWDPLAAAAGTMSLKERFALALRAEPSIWPLRETVKALLATGVERARIYDALGACVQSLYDAERDDESEVVVDVMSHLTGFCSGHMRL